MISERTLKMWFDDELIESDDWTSGDESFYRGNTVRLAKRLIETRVFKIEYGEGFFGQVISATFDLTSLDQAIEPVRTFCDW